MDKVTEGATSIVGSVAYIDAMRGIMDAFLTGAIARVITLLLIGVGLWFALRREQLTVGFLFMFAAMLLMFGQGVARWLGLF